MSHSPSHDHGYWQSLRELDGDTEFLDGLSREFPSDAELPVTGMSRRRFLQVMSASVALAGLSGCEWPEEEILPFGRRPEGYQPGRLAHFATSLMVAGHLRPVLASSYDGRPIKLEGNPEHPLSLGATDARTQAEILGLYDPDRSRTPRRNHAGIPLPATWDEAESAVFEPLRQQLSTARIACLFRDPPSRSTRAVLRSLPGIELFAEFAGPSSWRPMSHRVERAHVLACFDDDFLVDHDESLRSARQFAAARDPRDRMNRLYCIEAIPTSTGATADHRIVIDADRIGEALSHVAARLAARGGLARPEALASFSAARPQNLDEASRHALDALADDLAAAGPAALVSVGEGQDIAVQQLAARVNDALGAAGNTVFYRAVPSQRLAGLAELAERLDEGSVDALFVFESNPVHTAPGDLDFSRLLSRAELSVHVGLYEDETAAHCHWHLPLAHALESWDLLDDGEGRLCGVQPLIEPLFGGRTVAEVLARLIDRQPDESNAKAHSLTREAYAAATGMPSPAPDGENPEFERRWEGLLRSGFEASESEGGRPDLRGAPAPIATADSEGRCLQLSHDPKLHDGRYANNAWLQELPDALTKITWDNALLMGPATATELGLHHADVARVRVGSQSLDAPVFVLPGTAPRTLGLYKGYGRKRAGRVGTGVGVNANQLATLAEMYLRRDVSVEATGRKAKLACTQEHWAIDARGAQERQRRIPELVREGTLEDFEHHPEFAQHLGVHHPPLRSLWNEREGEGHQWAMAIDLNRCTTCNSCVVACQAENNVPVVGKEQVSRGREMHWLRLDLYFAGSAQNPRVVSQPMGCAHCELAPCEQVCPVGATMHSTEGLNVMAYNRCVGTRYCSNNCPYKVRRFNFFNYRNKVSEVESLAFNPEVTIRARGVMEKCTYCVQRIEHARIDAKNQGRPLRDGDIVTACQQSCPTQAIRFGDLSDAESGVSRLHEDERAYAVLAELNIKPRTRYLARIRNPHPGLESPDPHDATAEHGGHDS